MHIILLCYITCLYDLFAYTTFKQDCPAHITFRADESGDYLQVKNLCLEHNHDLSRVSLMMEAMLFIWSQLCLHCTFVGTIQASTSTTATLSSREGKGGCSIRYKSE